MIKKKLPLSKAYQLLEPGPVIMVSTAYKGTENVMTLSWKTMIDFVPPIVAIIMSDRNYSFNLLMESKECVINIPSIKLIDKVVGVGNTTGAKVDKFKKFQLTKVPACKVKAPLIDECFANLECKVIDSSMVKKYDMFILEVVAAWIERSGKREKTFHHCGNGIFVVDGKVIKTKSKKK